MPELAIRCRSDLVRNLLLLLLLTCSSGPALAEIYKWVDKNGKTHFGDKPPAGAVQPETVEINPPAGESGGALSDAARRDRQRRLLDDYAQQRNDKKAAAAKKKEELAARKRRCALARDKLENMRTAGYLYDLDDKGERVVLSYEARAKIEQESAAAVREHCN